MKYLLIASVLLQTSLAFSYAEKYSNTDKLKSAKQVEQVKIEKGGLLILEQVQKEEKMNDTFLVTQECTKKNNKLVCKVVRIDGKSK